MQHNGSDYTIYFDGAGGINCQNLIGYGFVVYHRGSEVHSYFAGDKNRSSNEAEWLALIEALRWCADQEFDRIIIYGDSRLIVNQFNGSYAVRNAKLKPLYDVAREICRNFSRHISLKWVPREQNKRADELSKQGLALQHQQQ